MHTYYIATVSENFKFNRHIGCKTKHTTGDQLLGTLYFG